MALSHAHLIKLRRSALSDGQIEALGWNTLPNGRLLIPYLRPDGRPETCHDGRPFCRERLSDADIAADPKGGKYRSPRGEGCRLFHSPLAIAAGGYAERLQDPYTPLRITEGEAKTVAASIHDLGRLTIGLGGVSAWRDRYDAQGHEAPSRPLVDWEEIPLLGREVRLCFDSDREKPQVAAALRDLAEFLAERGAEVLVEVLPHGLDGERLGVDDLIDRHGPEVFLAIARIAKSPFKTSQVRGETQRRWAFDGQPSNTYERNVVLAGLMGPDWRRSPDGADHWLRWCGSHWQAVAGDDLLAADVERFMELQGWRNRELTVVNSLLAAFRRAIKPAPEISSQGTCAGLVPFCNGCLALDGLVLLPHSRHHGHRWSLPYAYDPEATCERAQAFLLDRLGDTASVAVFRAFARALLIGERLKCFLEISGVSNTGKSVLANLLVALAGPQNTAAGKLNRLEDASQRFETLKLRGKRLAIFSECHDYRGQLQTLKAITGGDPIPAEVKGGRHLDFTFHGGVVLVGNGPIRASDASGAVINRRRSLPVNKVVAAAAERVMLEPDGSGGWRGELVAELPGLVNWALAMAPEEARAALARDVHSLARAEAELDTLLATDLLAEWAEASLVWSPQSHLRVGTADAPADGFLFSSYLRFIQQQGGNSRPLGLRTFKAKLVDLLRDTLSLPLPAGHPTAGAYRLRGVGSVVPGLAWRGTDEEAPGVIRQLSSPALVAWQRRRGWNGIETGRSLWGTAGTDRVGQGHFQLEKSQNQTISKGWSPKQWRRNRSSIRASDRDGRWRLPKPFPAFHPFPRRDLSRRTPFQRPLDPFRSRPLNGWRRHWRRCGWHPIQRTCRRFQPGWRPIPQRQPSENPSWPRPWGGSTRRSNKGRRTNSSWDGICHLPWLERPQRPLRCLHLWQSEHGQQGARHRGGLAAQRRRRRLGTDKTDKSVKAGKRARRWQQLPPTPCRLSAWERGKSS